MRCGVLALQGAFAAHQQMLTDCGAVVRLLRQPSDLAGIEALVLPGGESTTMVKLLQSSGLWPLLADLIAKGLPTFATCAGVILLANRIHNYPQQRSFAVLDAEVDRNGYGRQLDSRPQHLAIPVLGPASLPVLFIRAPRVLANGAAVKVLARYQQQPVLMQQHHLLAATFHSELSGDLRLHRYFLSLAESLIS